MNGGPSALARHFVAVTDEILRSAQSCFSSMNCELCTVLALVCVVPLFLSSESRFADSATCDFIVPRKIIEQVDSGFARLHCQDRLTEALAEGHTASQRAVGGRGRSEADWWTRYGAVGE